MSGGSNQPTTTQTTTQQLPNWAASVAQPTLQGYANYLYPNGQLIGNPIPPQQIQGFTPAQIQGQNYTTSIAAGPSQQVPDLALQNAAMTQSGAMLNPQSNPWLRDTYNEAASAMADQYMYGTAPQTAAQFAMANNFGGSAMQDLQNQQQFGFGTQLNDLATNIYGGAYQQGLQNQLSQQQNLPNLLESQYINPSMLSQVGDTQQQFGQNVLNTQYQNATQNANWPYTAAQQISSLLGPLTGNSSTSTTSGIPNPNYQSPLQQGAGLGQLGLLGLLLANNIP